MIRWRGISSRQAVHGAREEGRDGCGLALCAALSAAVVSCDVMVALRQKNMFSGLIEPSVYSRTKNKTGVHDVI